MDSATCAKIKDNKTNALVRVIQDHAAGPITKILVVGCGDGREAAFMAQSFNARATGIDIGEVFAFDEEAKRLADLRIMDARNLEFDNATFDFVYSFHALEHIPGPEKALSEMARVATPGATYLIGTPNKSRLVGYLNAAGTLSDKINWNIADYKMRFSGRWSNEAGAHAGFREAELVQMCRSAFGNAAAVSDKYYRTLYSSKAQLVDFLTNTGTSSLLFPAVYVCGQNRA
jgi:ubiquinone/menaquinone biosynthesis C-methylase UbiE